MGQQLVHASSLSPGEHFLITLSAICCHPKSERKNLGHVHTLCPSLYYCVIAATCITEEIHFSYFSMMCLNIHLFISLWAHLIYCFYVLLFLNKFRKKLANFVDLFSASFTLFIPSVTLIICSVIIFQTKILC